MPGNHAAIAFSATVGAFVGFACGTIPLRAAVKRDRTVIGLVCFVMCVGAGALGGLCLGIPTALILAGFIKTLGPSRPEYTTGSRSRPWGNESLEPDDGRPEEPYTRIGTSVVCSHCQTATRAERGDDVPAECPNCGLRFRRRRVIPVVRPARRDDDIIDLERAPPVGRR